MLYRSLTLCECAIVDARTNNLSLINILEQIQIIGFPALIPKISIVALLQKEETDTETQYPFRLRMRLNEKELFAQQVMANFMGKPKTRLLIDMNGLPITTQGTLVVELLKEQEVVMSSSIEVKMPERPQVTQRNEDGDRKG